MSPFWGQVAGVITVVLKLAFNFIWVWDWLPQHKRTFDALAKLPLADTEDER